MTISTSGLNNKSAITRGFKALKAGQYEEALEHYQRAWQQYPGLRSSLEFNILYTADKAGVTPPHLTPFPLQHDTDGEEEAQALYSLYQTSASIDIVMPVYNALDEVKACLASVTQNNDRYRIHLIVVNDGSDQATSQFLRHFAANTAQPKLQITLLENDTNQGYTRTVNRGLKQGTGDYVVTLNSDTRVTSGWLNGLIRCMHHDSKVAICGPLSNAASWQNVPKLTEQGAFAVNQLPAHVTADQMAALVRLSSAHEYPHVPFINGFCMMLKREVLNIIGYLDEANFPTGYGEENDLCIRAREAGFKLAIADDTYVFHSKSKSFGHDKRKMLSKRGSEALKAKWGEKAIEQGVATLKSKPELARIRDNVQQAIERQQSNATGETLKVIFCLPLAGGGGGVHSIVQEACGLRALGVDAQIGVPERFRDDFLQSYADIEERELIFTGVPYQGWSRAAADCDVFIATIFKSVKIVANAAKAHPKLKTAYYVQDYEPYFTTLDDTQKAEAEASYTALTTGILFAKTWWIADKVYQSHGSQVFKVSPSLDHSVYFPTPQKPADSGKPVVISAMIRPATPRRGAERTLRLLANILQRSKQPVRILTFGCDQDVPALSPYLGAESEYSDINPKHWRHMGILNRPQVADVLRRSDIFIDLSDYQAFGRTGLEAMACGCALITTKFGGVYEYVQEGQHANSMVVNPYDEEACFEALLALCNNPQQLKDLQRSGSNTAKHFTVQRASQSLYDILR